MPQIKKIDVAIQSYKKPESLIYSLLSLHRVSKRWIDEVWINDDLSGGEILEIYRSEELKRALHPWKIHVRQNSKRMGWWISFVKGKNPQYLSLGYRLLRMFWNLYKNKTIYVAREDIRYQWALDSTNKKFVFLMHDDITFTKDVVGIYLKKALTLKKPSIIGDLGQCWRCPYFALSCRPDKIIQGYRPHPSWPNTQFNRRHDKWVCRVNEWSALISVDAAKAIEKKYQIFFGNYDDQADLGGYWFSRAVLEHFEFDDPIKTYERDTHYIHWENGVTGHSVWTNQSFGKSSYDKKAFRLKLKKDFNFKLSWSQFDGR